MDDDGSHGGIGGLAMYQLGRWSAEANQQRSATCRAILQDRQALEQRNQWEVAHRALAQENEQLRQQLAKALFDLDTYKENYDELRRWADGAEETMRKLGVLKPRR